MSFRIFKTSTSIFLESSDAPGPFRHVDDGFSFDDLFTSAEPAAYIAKFY